MLFFLSRRRRKGMDESLLKERLLKENPAFRKLCEEHRQREIDLAALKEKPFLSDEERLEEKELKKKKLALKDQMYRIMKDYQKSA
jgi:uncharacterized protein YdcH (DUF465 family)